MSFTTYNVVQLMFLLMKMDELDIEKVLKDVIRDILT